MAVQAGNKGLLTWAEFTTIHSHKDEIVAIIDPTLVLARLHAKHFQVPNTLLRWIQEGGHNQTEINLHLLCHAPVFISFNDLMDVLNACGYQHLVASMYRTLMKLNTSLDFISKSTSGQRSGTHKFFRRLKSMVHDAQFAYPTDFLRDLASRYQDKMRQERDPIKKQVLADQVVAIIGAEIDARGIMLENDLTENDIFKQMWSLTNETSNTITTEVIYYGRKANASSMAGDLETGEEMMRRARCQASFLGQSLEVVNMLYTEVYVLLWKFEKFPTAHIRDMLMTWGRIGLQSLNDLEESDPGTKFHWRPMFIQRMVFCLLGIGNRANIIHGCDPDDNCVAEATGLLDVVEQQRYKFETRRKMFYEVAWGRLYQLKNQTTECLQHLKQAKALAKQGSFKELKFISQFYQILSVTEDRKITEIPQHEQTDREDSHSTTQGGLQHQQHDLAIREVSENVEDSDTLNIHLIPGLLSDETQITVSGSLNTYLIGPIGYDNTSQLRMMGQPLDLQHDENGGQSPSDETEVKLTGVIEIHPERSITTGLESSQLEANIYPNISQITGSGDQSETKQKGFETDYSDQTQLKMACILDDDNQYSGTGSETKLTGQLEEASMPAQSGYTTRKAFHIKTSDFGQSEISQTILKASEDSLTQVKVNIIAADSETLEGDCSETTAKAIAEPRHTAEETRGDNNDLLGQSMSNTTNLPASIQDQSTYPAGHIHNRTQDQPSDIPYVEMQTLHESSFDNSSNNTVMVQGCPTSELAMNQSPAVVLNHTDNENLDSARSQRSEIMLGIADKGHLDRESLDSRQSSELMLCRGELLDRSSLESDQSSHQYEIGPDHDEHSEHQREALGDPQHIPQAPMGIPPNNQCRGK